MHDVLAFESHCELSYPMFRHRLKSYYLHLVFGCIQHDAPKAAVEILDLLCELLSFYDEPGLRDSLKSHEDVIVRVQADSVPKVNIRLFDRASLELGRPEALFSTSLIQSTALDGEGQSEGQPVDVHIPSSAFNGDGPHIVLSDDHAHLVVSASCLRRLRPTEAEMQMRKEKLRQQAEDIQQREDAATADEEPPFEPVELSNIDSREPKRDHNNSGDWSSVLVPVAAILVTASLVIGGAWFLLSKSSGNAPNKE
jgi:hypothetical protein